MMGGYLVPWGLTQRLWRRKAGGSHIPLWLGGFAHLLYFYNRDICAPVRVALRCVPGAKKSRGH